MVRSFIGLLFVIAVALAGGATAGEPCITDWSVAAPIVKNEGLVTVEQLTVMGKGRLDGDIVKVTLCEEKGGFAYRLVIRDAKGSLKTVSVDAKNPF